MSELRPVSGPPSRSERNVWRLVALVLTGILLAVLKPWGSGIPQAPIAAGPTPAPSATPAQPTPANGRGPLSDFLTFGTNEPPPGWELWPAGNLASFYFAMRINMGPIPPGEPSGSAEPSPTSTPTPVPTEVAASIPDDWPTIRIPAGSTLDLLGINHPVGYEIVLSKFEQIDGAPGQPLRAVLATSPWPDHFTVFAVASGAAGTIGPWPPGRYRLELRIDPDGVTRSVEIVVEAAAEKPAPSRAPAESPSPSP